MEIKISKSAKACTVCERPFLHEESYYSRLDLLDAEEPLLRTDYCADCWKEAEARSAYSMWSPQYYDPDAADAAEHEVAYSPLRQLFYEAVAAEDRAESAKAFLAAQLLKRQKVFRLLKESDESDGEVKLLLYTDRIGGRLIEVRDPNFTYAELDTARKGLLERLRELEAPPTEAAGTAETPVDSVIDPEAEPPASDESEALQEVEHATPHDV